MRNAVLLAVLLFAIGAIAQEAAPSATVYVYRYKQFAGSGLEPSIYCDDVELARMDNGRWFAINLPPGKHAIRANDKQAVVEVDVKAGGRYYFRVEIVTGFMKGHGRIVLMMPEQGGAEIKKLQYSGKDKIKDERVLKVPPTDETPKQTGAVLF